MRPHGFGSNVSARTRHNGRGQSGPMGPGPNGPSSSGLSCGTLPNCGPAYNPRIICVPIWGLKAPGGVSFWACLVPLLCPPPLLPRSVSFCLSAPLFSLLSLFPWCVQARILACVPRASPMTGGGAWRARPNGSLLDENAPRGRDHTWCKALSHMGPAKYMEKNKRNHCNFRYKPEQTHGLGVPRV